MAKRYSRVLFTEDWSAFATGQISRDNSARGEYMAMVVPENPNGWYHNASAGPARDREHSRFEVRKRGKVKKLVLPEPVNWTGDGRELIAFSPRHGDGGLWDESFDLVVPFPGDERPGKYMEVHDLLGLGVDQLIVWNEETLHLYAPREIPTRRKGRKVYSPERPGPNLSNYQVNYSIPRWT